VFLHRTEEQGFSAWVGALLVLPFSWTKQFRLAGSSYLAAAVPQRRLTQAESLSGSSRRADSSTGRVVGACPGAGLMREGRGEAPEIPSIHAGLRAEPRLR
jgi:hypothetical protein